MFVNVDCQVQFIFIAPSNHDTNALALCSNCNVDENGRCKSAGVHLWCASATVQSCVSYETFKTGLETFATKLSIERWPS